jgi:hypothetical protein
LPLARSQRRYDILAFAPARIVNETGRQPLLALGNVPDAQTLPGFNDVYKGTIEWRLERKPDGKLKPFATILRWNVMTNPDDRQASGRKLVVTKLGPGGVCHVGYVDAGANPDANELAQTCGREGAHVQVWDR